MSDQFQSLMNAVEDDLLEEAMTPVKRRNPISRIGISIAACLLLVFGMTVFTSSAPTATATELAELGYELKLPEEAEQVRYEIVTLSGQKGAQARFVMQDTEYVYQAVKVEQQLSDNSAEGDMLSWNAGNLDIRLLASSTSTSVSWYAEEAQTRYYLTANANTPEVLTTAAQILQATGLNVFVAPKTAENITYNVFLLDGLTVAETTFQVDGITYAYRIAGTLETQADFADISELALPFARTTASKVFWCEAKLSFNPNEQGKIIWFDVVPGIVHSLSMDTGASEEALLHMANALFEPAQGDN